jgi:serine phosphatase RsbU (regulator of sigma subunit)
VLAIYSDGVSEAQSIRDDEFGPEGVVACVRALRSKSATEILRFLEQSLFEFASGRPYADDRTAVILKAL